MPLPAKESDPISTAKSREPPMIGSLSWTGWRNSSPATSAAAPPPRPLKRATICGMAVIFTE